MGDETQISVTTVVMLSCLFLTSLWSLAGETADRLALLYVVFSSDFVTFPYGVLGEVRYLIVSFPDICLLPYFKHVDCSVRHYELS